MKRITALFILIAMLMSLCLSSCKSETTEAGENENTEVTDEQNGGDTAEEKDDKKEETDTSKGNNKTTTTTTTTTVVTNDNVDSGNASPDTKSSNDASNGNTDTGSDNKQEPVTNDTPVTETPDKVADDADLGEITYDTSDGENDTRFDNVDDGVKYETNVPSSVENLSLSASDLDESKLTLPVVRIETLDGSGVDSKSVYESAYISVSNTSAAYTMNKFAVEVRGRGNSTWSYCEKKAYKLRFGIAQDMFGMGAGKKWVLLANALDETMLRNYLTLSLAKSIGVEFATDCQFISLYINDKYMGVYLLCEQVQEGKNRVDVNTSKTGEVDTGYFLEGINNSASVEYKIFTVPVVNGKSLGKGGNFRFIIKSPNELECTGDQFSFISKLVTNANDAIFNKDWAAIQEYCDIDSFVNLFIINEVSLNNDMGYSFYLYRKAGGKLCIGPVWDYDQAMGASSHGGSTYKGWYAGSELQWFTTLIEIPEFKELVKKKYSSCKASIDGLVNKVDSTVTKYRYDFAMDEALWANYGNYRWRITPELAALKTYNEHLSYLKTWLTNRIKWMDHELGI